MALYRTSSSCHVVMSEEGNRMSTPLAWFRCGNMDEETSLPF